MTTEVALGLVPHSYATSGEPDVGRVKGASPHTRRTLRSCGPLIDRLKADHPAQLEKLDAETGSCELRGSPRPALSAGSLREYCSTGSAVTQSYKPYSSAVVTVSVDRYDELSLSLPIGRALTIALRSF